MHVLLDDRLELSNNKAGRAVKSLVMDVKIGWFPARFTGIVLILLKATKRHGLDLENIYIICFNSQQTSMS